jgi:molybdopterin-guanine dinucleotide biosynthesis protein A
VVAALEHVSGPILVVATDQPWARPDTLRRLAAAASDLALVPVGHDGTRQTTCAVYPAGLLPVALDELLAGGSIQSVLDRASFTPVSEEEWRGWGEDGRSWYSADSPEAIAYGLRRFGTPSAPGSARQR